MRNDTTTTAAAMTMIFEIADGGLWLLDTEIAFKK
jgi:hypothetical protein